MKLFRSTLAIAAITLSALTLYLDYAALTPTNLADAAPAATVLKSSDLTPFRTMVQNIASVVTKVVDAKKRVADLGVPKDPAEGGLDPRATNDWLGHEKAATNTFTSRGAGTPMPVASQNDRDRLA